MPYATDGQIKIYYEMEGQGPPILLAHGSTGSTSFWRGYGYVDQLKHRFTVILYDARGHGMSDKPHEAAAYSYQLMAGDGLAVLDALSIGRSHFWGYSMGGYTGFELARTAPDRLLSLIAGGTGPYDAPGESEEPNLVLQIFERGVLEGPDAMVEGMVSLFGVISPQYEERLRSLDPQAMVALMTSAENRPGLGDVISSIRMPCLLYAGEEDDSCFESSRRAAEEMTNARFFSLSGLNHVGASSAVELVMPEVLSFLARDT